MNDKQPALQQQLIEQQLREALQARAALLGLDPESITVPTPGALIASDCEGTLLRLDYRVYTAHELSR